MKKVEVNNKRNPYTFNALVLFRKAKKVDKRMDGKSKGARAWSCNIPARLVGPLLKSLQEIVTNSEAI